MADEFELIAMREMLTDYVREAPEANVRDLARFVVGGTQWCRVPADLCDQIDAELAAADHLYRCMSPEIQDRVTRADIRSHRDKVRRLQRRLAAYRTQARSASESP